MPGYSWNGKDLQPKSIMKETFRVGVRLHRDPGDQYVLAIPEVGSIVQFDFDNSDRANNKAHRTIKRNICQGRVDNLGGRAWLEKTRTDFCVLMTKARGIKQPRGTPLGLSRQPPPSSPPKSTTESRRDKDLMSAKIEAIINHEPALRDIEAFEKFCDETHELELLDEIRLAFWSDPSKAPNLTDLTKGPANDRSNANKKRYMAIVDELKAKRKSNKSQDAVLKAASSLRNRVSVLQGPPGAGKTRTLRDKVIALTKIWHKAACVASSNVAVDTITNSVYSDLDPEERNTYKYLRLESGNVLDTQYYIYPALSLFPRKQFYDNKGLKDSDMVKEDDEVRKAMRQITKDLKCTGDKGEGTEYVVTNVPNGCSRAELNGTSLVNHANADVIIRMINRFISGGGIKASMITVLAYYQGQRRLLRRTIDRAPWSQEIKDAIEISTVDAFQGRESRIVIVDTVAAKDKFQGPVTKEEDAAEDAEDRGGENYIKVGVSVGFDTRDVVGWPIFVEEARVTTWNKGVSEDVVGELELFLDHDHAISREKFPYRGKITNVWAPPWA